MMIKPGITELSRYVDSRYTLVSMAAKRARMVSVEQNTAEEYDAKADKPVTVAVNEVAKGKVGYVRSESIKKAKEWEKEKAEAMSFMMDSDNIFNAGAVEEAEALAEEIAEDSDAEEKKEDNEE